MSDTKQVENENNWCHRAETTNLLALSIAQIHMSLTEGDNSIETLTESFQKLANFCDKFEQLADKPNDDSSQQALLDIASNMSSQVNNAIVAFQFYDRLCQRLDHVTASLNGLAELLKDDTHFTQVNGWQALREQIKKQYTMQAEHEMYELIMQGYSPELALEQFKASLLENKNDDDDIELF